MPEQVEKILSRITHKDNLRMWGQLYVSKTGRTVGGWLVDSWSEHGAPYWTPKMHWFAKQEGKLYHVQLNVDYGHSSMNIYGEDVDIASERSKFIRETLEKWELEWLEDESKGLS
jgi:hypothetical protein